LTVLTTYLTSLEKANGNTSQSNASLAIAWRDQGRWREVLQWRIGDCHGVNIAVDLIMPSINVVLQAHESRNFYYVFSARHWRLIYMVPNLIY
jgi:hypothetical protein